MGSLYHFTRNINIWRRRVWSPEQEGIPKIKEVEVKLDLEKKKKKRRVWSPVTVPSGGSE